jgi:hypothetical protein
VKRLFEKADESRPGHRAQRCRTAPPAARRHRQPPRPRDGRTATSATCPALAAAIPRKVRFAGEFGVPSVPESATFSAPERWPDLDWDELAAHHGSTST